MKDLISWLYLITVIILCLYGLHFYIAVFLFKKGKKANLKWKKALDVKEEDYPFVTVQLPIFNESNVAERLIENSIKMQYPKDKLEIQVLDDSTDETQTIAKTICDKYKKQGYNIEYVHRVIREGYKAGALKEGLKTAKGEFIAIFDADFIPNSDFLMQTVPFFINHKNLALVQTRWDYYNKNYSFLTQIQATALDGHFMVEQKARSDNSLWFNFNGTAGIWRKEAIYDAGNWNGDTLTEDLDLSYRAQIKGWETLYYRDIGHQSELPINIPAYKSQQFRWAKGAFQCLKKLFLKIIFAKSRVSNKLEAMIHLINYSAFLFLVINFILMLPMAYLSQKYDYNPWEVVPWYVAVAFFLVGLSGPILYFVIAQMERKSGVWFTLKSICGLIVLNFGLTLLIVKAFIEAMIGKKSSFIRTPKFNLSNKTDKKEFKQYKLKIDYITIMEFIAGLYGVFTILFCVVLISRPDKQLYGIAFFALLYTIGYFWMCFGTLKQNLSNRVKKIKITDLSLEKNKLN